MGRSAEIMKASLGLDFNDFESGSVAFDYEGLMKATGYTIEEVDKIQSKTRRRPHSAPRTQKHNKTGKKICQAGIRRKDLRKGRSCQRFRFFQGQTCRMRCSSRQETGLQGRYRCNFRKLRRSRCFPGSNAGNEVHNRSGMLRLPRRRPA